MENSACEVLRVESRNPQLRCRDILWVARTFAARDKTGHFRTFQAMSQDRRRPQGNRRLDSWKEIASFFDRDERTVRRWEKERDLPVRRLPGLRGGVYAFTDDLSQWMNAHYLTQSSNAAGVTAGPEAAALATTSAAVIVSQPEVKSSELPADGPAPSGDAPPDHARTIAKWVIAICVLIVAFVVTLTAVRRQRAESAVARGTSSAAAPDSPAVRAEAEDLYLKGRYYWNKRTPDDLNKAVDYFTQAIVRDPNYAKAYVGLSDCYNLLREYTVMPPEEAYPRAMAAAQKAIELDPSSAEAHNSLAFGSFYWMWDAATAEREFRRALALDPNYVLAHHWYATFLHALGRSDESLKEINRAQELDPSSTTVLADKGVLLYAAGQKQEAVTLLKQIEDTEPSFLSPHRYLATIYLDNGDYAGYLAEAEKAALLTQDKSALAIVRAGERGLAAGGSDGMLNEILQTQKALYSGGGVAAYSLASTYARLGNKVEALKYLEISRDRHETMLMNLRSDPSMKSLYGDPSFRTLLSQVGLFPVHGS
jgi:tetratricopeptide (TPR) repeat protein